MASRKTPQPNTTETAPASPPESPVDDVTQAAVEPAASEEADVAAPLAPELTQEPRYRVSSRSRDGFCRAGRRWHPDGEVLTLSALGGLAVLNALRDEPMLVVEEA